jgi:hypothetical protein
MDLEQSLSFGVDYDISREVEREVTFAPGSNWGQKTNLRNKRRVLLEHCVIYALNAILELLG